MNPDGDGAKYRRSDEISVIFTTPSVETVTSPWPGIITGILADWVGFSPFIGFTFATSH